MNGSNSAGYIDAMNDDFFSFQDTMKVCDIVDRYDSIKFLGSTWVFR